MNTNELLLDIYAVVSNIENDRQLLIDLGIRNTTYYPKLQIIYDENSATLNDLFTRIELVKEMLQTAADNNHRGILKERFTLLSEKISKIGVEHFTDILLGCNDQKKKLNQLFHEYHGLQPI